MPSKRFSKPRSPSIFPVLFADTVERAQLSGLPQFLRQFPTRQAARSYLNIFRDWRYCLRNWPGGGRCSDIELGPNRIHAWIEPIDGVFLTMVEIRTDFRRSLPDLNPELFSPPPSAETH